MVSRRCDCDHIRVPDDGVEREVAYSSTPQTAATAIVRYKQHTFTRRIRHERRQSSGVHQSCVVTFLEYPKTQNAHAAALSPLNALPGAY